MANTLDELTNAGVSLWLDDLARSRITSGNLKHLISHRHIRGVTTNPTIFEKAISSGASEYADQLTSLAHSGATVDDVVRSLTAEDVRRACDLFTDVWRETDGVDGRVSIEVDPRLAHDTEATARDAALLWDVVDRPNLLVKIPATPAGLPAITEVVGRGISVNVTLIFSVDRYRQVMDAYAKGLEVAVANRLDIASIYSVASFFVSRVDTEVDRRLDALGTSSALAIRGRAAIANVQLAWAAYQDFLQSSRWAQLAARRARPQRPLWASTGVKDPTYDDTRYVVDLVAPGVVNTMPELTLDAVADHGVFRGDTLSGTEQQGQSVWTDLQRLGIDMDDVFQVLEDDGVNKFVSSWNDLRAAVEMKMQSVA